VAARPIRLYPDPILRQSCAAVTAFDGALARLAADLVATMHQAPGVGLAAPQVGVATRLAVVDLSVGKDAAQLYYLVNPEVVVAEGSQDEKEGCLSIPEFTERVERPARVLVRALDLAGRPYEIAATELLARAVCHEIDHLDGVLFVDRLCGLRRERARRFLRRMARGERRPEVVSA
jgi:peptide deformylase